MARKRKRFNKKVVILLALIALVFVGVGVGYLIVHQPRDPKIYAERAAKLVKQGNYRAAVKDYGIAASAASDADKPKYLLALADTLLEWSRKDKSLTASNRARLYYTARDKLMEALRYDPKFLEAQRRLTQIEISIGRSSGDMERCIRAADDLLKLQPDNEAVLFQRALAEMQLSRTREIYLSPAVKDFSRLVKIAPENERYWLGLIELKNQMLKNDPRRIEQIEGLYRQALKANPKSVLIRAFYARFLERNKRKEDALKVLVEATKLQPHSSDAYLELASFYRRSGEVAKTIDSLVQATKANPSDYRPYAGLARIYAIQGQSDKAKALLLKGLKAIKADKKIKPAEYDIGIAVLNSGLCDVLLDGLNKDTKPEEKKAVVEKVNELLKEIEDTSAESPVAKRIQPYIDKVSGRLALIQGRLVEAERLLRSAYDSFENFEPKTAELLINLYRRLGQLGEAQKIQSRYLLLAKGRPSAALGMAKLYIDAREYDQALRLIQKVLEQQVTEEVLSLKVALEAVMGRRKRIPAPLKKLDRAAVRLFLIAARQLWMEGERLSAIQLVKDVLEREPNSPSALLQLLQWYTVRKQTGKAQAVLARIRKIYKDNPRVLQRVEMLLETDRDKLLANQLKLAETEPDPVARALIKAGVYRSFGNEQKYLEYLEKAERKDPKNPEVVRLRFEDALRKRDWKSAEKYAALAGEINIDGVEGKMYKARLEALRGNLDEAINLASQAIQISPHFGQYHAFLGDCYFAKGQFEQAKTEYETARSQSPSNMSALKGLIRVSERLGNSEDYAHWVTLAYRIAPYDSSLRERYLALSESSQDPEKVIRMRENIRKSDPGNLTNLLHLARLYEQTGRFTLAEQAYRDVVKRSGQSPWAMGILAKFLYRTHRDVEARQMLANWAQTRKDKVGAYLVMGAYLDSAGSTDQAKTIFQKAIDTAPSDPRGYLAMARFFARRGKWSQAVRYQKEFIAHLGKKALGSSQKDLVIYLVKANMLEEAERLIDKELQKTPDNIDLLRYKAVIRMKQKRDAEARQILDHILTIRSDYIPALIARADLYLKAGRKHKAISDLEAARRAGAPVEVGIKLARLYEEIGDFGNAQAVLKSLLGESPKSSPVLKELAGLYFRHKRWVLLREVLSKAKGLYPRDTYFLMIEANMWRQRNMLPQAVAALEKAAKIAPDNHSISLALTDALAMSGQYQKVLSMAEGLRKYDDVAPQATAVLGLALAKTNRLDQAEKMFIEAMKTSGSSSRLIFVCERIKAAYPVQEAIKKIKRWSEVLPKEAWVYYTLGSVFKVAGDYASAAEFLSKALSRAKTDHQKRMVKRDLALVEMYLGHYRRSIELYEELLKETPDDVMILNNLAWLLSDKEQVRNLDKALQYAERAFRLMPNDSNILDTYGYILYLKGRYNKALEALVGSVRIRAIPANRLHLGMVYEKMNRKDDAVRQYRLAWELVKDKPDSPYYKQIRDALGKFESVRSGRNSR